MGVSFHSPERACSNAQEEVRDKGWGFEDVRAQARKEWVDLLEGFDLHLGESGSGAGKGLEREYVRLFYSSLYRSHVVPADCEFKSFFQFSLT